MLRWDRRVLYRTSSGYACSTCDWASQRRGTGLEPEQRRLRQYRRVLSSCVFSGSAGPLSSQYRRVFAGVLQKYCTENCTAYTPAPCLRHALACQGQANPTLGKN